MGFLILTSGPGEPEGFKQLRARYYEHRTWVWALENRISRTQSGLAFLGRTKNLGYKKAA
jgi:hypothetical protein